MSLTSSRWTINATHFLSAFVVCLILLMFLRGVVLYYQWNTSTNLQFEKLLGEPFHSVQPFHSVKKRNDFHVNSCVRKVTNYKEAINVFDPEVVKQILVKQPYLFPISSRYSTCLSCNEKAKILRQSTIKAFGATKINIIVKVVDRRCICWVSTLITLKLKGDFLDMDDQVESFTQDVLLAVVLGEDHISHFGTKLNKLKDSWRNLNRSKHNWHCINLLKREDIEKNFAVQLSNIISETLDTLGGKFLWSILASCEKLQLTDQKHTCQQQYNTTDFLSQFLLYGQQSLSRAIKFVFFCLAKDLRVLKRLKKEISPVSEYPGIASVDVINKLEYLDCVVMESLRLLPMNNMCKRKSTGAILLENSHLPRGVELEINLQKMHHDPKLWQNPEIFYPERFSLENKSNQNAYQFLPFGAGPNFCIGMRLSLMIMKVVLVRFLPRFDLPYK